MNKIILVLGILLIPFLCICQSKEDYKPIKYSGEIPDEFYFDPLEMTLSQVKNENRLTEKEAKEFYANINFVKKDLFLSTDIYFNDILTNYVRTVAKNIFESDSSVLNNIKIYVTKYPSPNAISLPDGTILINLGLLSLLDNEAQLAFIIAHEVVHVEKQHSIETILKTKEIKSSEVNIYNPSGDFFRTLSYSRDNENTSDAKGLEYISASMYDANECSKSLKKLNDSNYLKFSSVINYSSILDSILLSDTSLFYQSYHADDDKTTFSLKEKYDDLFSTHPDLEKRIAAMDEILGIISYSNEGKIKNSFPENYAKRIKEISLFELTNNLTEQSDYGLSLYIAMHLNTNDPGNTIIQTLILKNLYWLAYYKEINSMTNVIHKHAYITQADYQKFYSFFNTVGIKELKGITYKYAKNNLEYNKGNEDFYFYYCLASEMFIGKDAAALLFRQFKKEHATSKYINFINYKLK